MKRTVQRTLAAEKRKIERRLGDAVKVNNSGPVLSAPNIRYELAEKTKAIAAGGIGAIHRLVHHIGLALVGLAPSIVWCTTSGWLRASTPLSRCSRSISPIMSRTTC